jgi:hypothetical protein
VKDVRGEGPTTTQVTLKPIESSQPLCLDLDPELYAAAVQDQISQSPREVVIRVGVP